jgi:predicted permease
VAFSMVLLIAAGVFIQTLARLRPADYHAPADRVLLFTMKPQQEIYSPDRIRAVSTELVRRISDLPGVASAALAENGPFGSRSSSSLVETPGHEPVQVAIDFVTPRFFDVVGIPRLAGRDFTTADRQGSPLVAIVNQALARSLFANQSPIGRTFLRTNDKTRVYEIVGVVADAHYYDVHTDPPPGAWFAIQQDVPYMPTLHVRTNDADTAAAMAAVRREFDAIDKGFPVFNIKTLEVRMEDSLARERMVAALSVAFGMLALVLAAIGLYGVLAYMVTRRTREIGIRMALGSSARSVLWLTAREALVLVGAGSLAGIAIATVASRVLAQYLFGASPVDPLTLLVSGAVMVGVAGIAVGLPAMRACRIDPLVALRQG